MSCVLEFRGGKRGDYITNPGARITSPRRWNREFDVQTRKLGIVILAFTRTHVKALPIERSLETRINPRGARKH